MELCVVVRSVHMVCQILAMEMREVHLASPVVRWGDVHDTSRSWFLQEVWQRSKENHKSLKWDEVWCWNSNKTDVRTDLRADWWAGRARRDWWRRLCPVLQWWFSLVDLHTNHFCLYIIPLTLTRNNQEAKIDMNIYRFIWYIIHCLPEAPALLTSIWSSFSSSRIWAANLRTDSREEVSMIRKCTSWLPLRWRISFSAAVPRASLLHARITLAPRQAKSKAMNLPIPGKGI